jgi:hypothetical protein
MCICFNQSSLKSFQNRLRCYGFKTELSANYFPSNVSNEYIVLSHPLFVRESPDLSRHMRNNSSTLLRKGSDGSVAVIKEINPYGQLAGNTGTESDVASHSGISIDSEISFEMKSRSGVDQQEDVEDFSLISLPSLDWLERAFESFDWQEDFEDCSTMKSLSSFDWQENLEDGSSMKSLSSIDWQENFEDCSSIASVSSFDKNDENGVISESVL